MNYSAEYFVSKLNLQAHPEGGFYTETYRSAEEIGHQSLPPRFSGDRSFSTAIYFLLEGYQFSAFHRIQSDEIWHFYYGEPLLIYVIHPGGEFEILTLGNDTENGSVFQAAVAAGCWFASKPAKKEGFSLVGCTVAPGFDFKDFELAKQQELLQKFPEHATLISSLCRG